MKKNLFKALLPLFTLLLLNCKKDEPFTAPDDTFIVGPSNGFVKIEKFDSLYVKYDELLIDLDGLGSDDLRLLSYFASSAGGYRVHESYVEVLNNMYGISVIDITDTIRSCENKINSTVSSWTYYNKASNFLCDSQYIDTIAYIISTTHPRVYSDGDTVTKSGIWEKGKLTLFHHDHSIFFQSTYDIITGNWNNQNMKYLVFNKNGTDEYGWIKISLVGLEIQVHEIARPS